MDRWYCIMESNFRKYRPLNICNEIDVGTHAQADRWAMQHGLGE